MSIVIPKQRYSTTHQGLFNQYINFLMANIINLRITDDKKEKLFNLFQEASRIVNDYPLTENENSHD